MPRRAVGIVCGLHRLFALSRLRDVDGHRRRLTARGAAIGLALLTRHLALEQPLVLALLGGIVIIALAGRRTILRRFAGS